MSVIHLRLLRAVHGYKRYTSGCYELVPGRDFGHTLLLFLQVIINKVETFVAVFVLRLGCEIEIIWLLKSMDFRD